MFGQRIYAAGHATAARSHAHLGTTSQTSGFATAPLLRLFATTRHRRYVAALPGDRARASLERVSAPHRTKPKAQSRRRAFGRSPQFGRLEPANPAATRQGGWAGGSTSPGPAGEKSEPCSSATQDGTKGTRDFPGVNCSVGVLKPIHGMGLPDFRRRRGTFQLLGAGGGRGRSRGGPNTRASWDTGTLYSIRFPSRHVHPCAPGITGTTGALSFPNGHRSAPGTGSRAPDAFSYPPSSGAAFRVEVPRQDQQGRPLRLAVFATPVFARKPSPTPGRAEHARRKKAARPRTGPVACGSARSGKRRSLSASKAQSRLAVFVKGQKRPAREAPFWA